MELIGVVHPPNTPWKAYIVVAILLVAGPGIFFGYMRHWARVQPGEPATEPNSWIAASSDSRMQAAAAYKPIVDVQVISDASPRPTLYNMPVDLREVGVRGVPDANGFWVSQVRTPEIFVSFGPNARRFRVYWRESLDVIGHARALPGRAEVRRRWPGLKGDNLERLMGQGVYVEAERVVVNGTY